VILAGQAGVIGHIRIGDLAKVGAQSGVGRDVEDGAIVSGSPAIGHREWLRSTTVFGQLSEMVKELRRLRHEVERLKGGKS
jgi:UDP-3-O-[3-hydroxymyristoyl] glucosamine N-acyltransferase